MEKSKEVENSKLTSNSKNRFRIDYYDKLSVEDFDIFCKRFLTLYQTGVYVPPPQKPVVCQNKKRKKTGPREYIPDKKEIETKFGKGRVGVSCQSYGVKSCACCQPNNGRPRILRNPIRGRREESELFELQIQEILANNLKHKKTKMNEREVLSVIDISDSDDTIMNLNTESQSQITARGNTNGTKYKDSLNNSVIILDNTIPTTSSSIVILSSDSDNDEIKENFQPTTNNNRLANDSNYSLRLKSRQLLHDLKNAVDNENKIQHEKEIQSASKAAKKENEKEKGKTSSLNLSCPICLEAFRDKEVMSTVCGHLFCVQCIKNCIKVNKCCPVCRTALTLKRIHPIFF